MSFLVELKKNIFRIVVAARLLYAYLTNPAGFVRRLSRPSIRKELSLGERYGKHGYVVPEGSDCKYHYVEKGSGPLMLFLHGFPQCWYTWRHQIEYFSRTHRVIAIDMKGFGESDKPFDLSLYDGQLLAKEIAGILDALGYQNEKFILVGHDWGGILSWTFAEAFPDRLKELVILNAPHMSTMRRNIATMPSDIVKVATRKLAYMAIFQVPWLGQIWASAFDGAWLDRAFGFSKERSKSFIPAEDRDYFKAAFFIPGVSRASLNYYSVTNWTRGDKNVPVRTLVIWGEDDAALHPEICLRNLQSYFSDVEIVRIPGCSHWVPEEEHVFVNETIAKFLKV